MTEGIETYKFNEAAGALYQFVWGTFCDWYVELAKPLLTGSDAAARDETRAMTAWVLDQILKLLHPFMPFVTEELWAKTGEQGPARESLLALAPWPELDGAGGRGSRRRDRLAGAAHLRGALGAFGANVPAGGEDPARHRRCRRGNQGARRAARRDHQAAGAAGSISFAQAAPKGSAQIVVGEATAALPLAGVIDMDAERKRIAREIDKTVTEIKKVDGPARQSQFMAKAPPEVVEENHQRKADFEATVKKLQVALKRVEAAASRRRAS